MLGRVAISLLLVAACGDSATTGSGGSAGGGGSESTGGSDSGGGQNPGGSSTGGAPEGGGGSTSSNGGGPPGQVPAIVAVGYGGIRIVSRDDGVTWEDRASEVPDGGDDEYLLRAVTWGAGTWVATGWRYYTSTDGVTWENHGMIADTQIFPCNIVEGLAFHDGAFWATCVTYLEGGNGPVTAVFRSTDAQTWGDPFSIIGATDDTTGGHVFMTTASGKLVVWGDTGTTFSSTDGTAWDIEEGIEAGIDCEGGLVSMAECDPTAVSNEGGNTYYSGVSWFDGVFLKGEWQGKIVRATDGVSYDAVYTDDELNSIYRGTAFAAGFAAP